MSKFVEGGEPGPGRPKGSKDKVKPYLSLKFWFNQLEKELAKKIKITRRTKDGLFVDSWETTAVSPDKRATIFLDAMKMLTAKMKHLPNSQADSIANAKEAANLLNEMGGERNTSELFVDPSISSPSILDSSVKDTTVT